MRKYVIDSNGIVFYAVIFLVAGFAIGIADRKSVV